MRLTSLSGRLGRLYDILKNGKEVGMDGQKPRCHDPFWILGLEEILHGCHYADSKLDGDRALGRRCRACIPQLLNAFTMSPFVNTKTSVQRAFDMRRMLLIPKSGAQVDQG